MSKPVECGKSAKYGGTSRIRRSAIRGIAGVMLGAWVLAAAGCAAPRGVAVVERGEPVKEIEFDAAADRAPTANTLYAMARLLAAQSRDAEAEVVLRRLVAEHPEFKLAYCDLAAACARNGRIEDGMAALAAGLERWDRDPVLLNNMGVCLMLTGRHSGALEYFTRAAAVAPHNARYRANMAAALGMLGRYEESLGLYAQIMSEPDAQHNLGVLHLARTRRSQR